MADKQRLRSTIEQARGPGAAVALVPPANSADAVPARRMPDIKLDPVKSPRARTRSHRMRPKRADSARFSSQMPKPAEI